MDIENNIPGLTPFDGYVSGRVFLDCECRLQPRDAEALVGKTVRTVQGMDDRLRITFTDGTILVIEGHEWNRLSLGIDVIAAPPDLARSDTKPVVPPSKAVSSKPVYYRQLVKERRRLAKQSK